MPHLLAAFHLPASGWIAAAVLVLLPAAIALATWLDHRAHRRRED